MRALYFLVKHTLPHTTLYGPLLDFCMLQGCDYLSSLHVTGNAHYRSEQIIQDFLAELDAQINSEQLQASPYIALMADDISVSKETDLVCSICSFKCAFLKPVTDTSCSNQAELLLPMCLLI